MLNAQHDCVLDSYVVVVAAPFTREKLSL